MKRNCNFLEGEWNDWIGGVCIPRHMIRKLPKIIEFRNIDCQNFNQIGRDGAMLYGESIDIYYEDIPELKELSREIGDRVEKDWWYCGECCEGYLEKDLTLSEIAYLYEKRCAEWILRRIWEQNGKYFKHYDHKARELYENDLKKFNNMNLEKLVKKRHRN